MKPEAYNAIVNEFKRSRQLKQDSLHLIWKSILDEYGIDNFGRVVDALAGSNISLNESSLDVLNGRVASLNVTVRKMVTLATIKEPEFTIDTENPMNEAIAQVLEDAFRPVLRKVKWQPEMRKALLDACLFGTGFVKVGLSSKYVYGEGAWSDSIPRNSEGLTDIEEQMPYGPTTEYVKPNIQDEWPNMVAVSPFDIFYNPGVVRDSDIARTYHRYRRRLLDVKRDARYSRKARAKILGTLPDGFKDDWVDYNDEAHADDVAYVELVEVFDHASRHYAVFNEDLDIPLRDWTPFTLPIHSPFERIVPIEHPRLLWGIPYALLLLPHSQAMNILRSVLIDQIKSDGKRVHLIDDQALFDHEDGITRLNNAAHNEFIEVRNLQAATKEGGDIIKTVEMGGASPEVLRLMSIVEGDQAMVSGLTDAARNQPSQGQTATEVSYRQQQQGFTVEQFLQINEEFQENVAASLCQVLLSEWGEERMVRVMGPSPELYFWVPIERSRVLTNFTMRIVVGSTERMDKLTQRRLWIELLPRLVEVGSHAQNDMQMQMQGFPPSPINWNEVLRMTLNLFDSSLSHKVLRQTDIAQLMIRLANQHNIYPVGASPALIARIQSMVSRRQSEQVGGLETQADTMAPGVGLAALAQPQITGGMGPQELPGNTTGRAASETMQVA